MYSEVKWISVLFSNSGSHDLVETEDFLRLFDISCKILARGKSKVLCSFLANKGSADQTG